MSKKRTKASLKNKLEGSFKKILFFRKNIKTFRKIAKTLSIIFFVMLIIVIVSGVFATITYAYFVNDMSSPDRLINRNNTGTVVYARGGETLYQTFGAKYRKLLDLNNIPDNLQKATIATEDKEFYSHNGISTKGVVRAFIKNFQAGEVKEGGSSITQQLVKNALLSPERSYSRKYKEIVLALELERKYNKKDILKMYFNEIYYGEGAWGIEDAAKVYYGKETKDLTLGESATLAGIPAAPSKYSPIENPKEAKDRQKYVLDNMKSQKMITEEAEKKALAEKPVLYGQKTEIKAPHFTMAVLDELRNEYGDDQVEKGGQRVYTTLDMEKQNLAEQAITKELPKFESKKASNTSLVSSDPKTGEILAMVGSADWQNSQWGKVSIPYTEQQPGSSFKPFAYITALEKGWTTITNIKDEPVSFKDDPPYVPRNYDGKFHGNVTLRKALANSYNIPAIKTLQFTGIDQTLNTAEGAGVTVDKNQKLGLSIVLGGIDVRLVDMVSGYGTFANGGTSIKPKIISKVIDNNNKDITKKEQPDSKKKIFDSAYTFILSDILTDNDARKDTFGLNSPLKLSRPAAAKTGTTDNYTDGWTMGYTPNLVTGVWLGNNDNTPMQELPGALGAGYIWNTYMESALKDMPVENFQKPSNVVEKRVWGNGILASAGSLGGKVEYFVSGTEPKDKEIAPPENDRKPTPQPKIKKKEEKAVVVPAPTPAAPSVPPPTQDDKLKPPIQNPKPPPAPPPPKSSPPTDPAPSIP